MDDYSLRPPQNFLHKLRHCHTRLGCIGFQLFILLGFVALPEEIDATNLIHRDVLVVLGIGPVATEADFTLLEVLPVFAVLAGPAFVAVGGAGDHPKVG
jgi:hypothetical protein